MVIQKRACAFHGDRAAIGVCVITKQPICAECSTRYEGVNYSKQGLKILAQRRAEAARASHRGGRWAMTLCALAGPVGLYMVYLFYRTAVVSLIEIQSWSFSG